MDWILDIYEQTEHLFAIVLIIVFMVSLVWTLRFKKFQEWEDELEYKVKEVLWLWIVIMLVLFIPGMFLEEQCKKRKEAQIEQVRQEQLVK
jgi:TRAP-type C4-dicarboxylate transport system permease large subunit